MQEEALLLGPYQSLAGVFTPATAEIEALASTAVICITAGLLHHVGPHRLHVLLARALAEKGISTLRFDLSGIGDSLTRPDSVPAQEVPVREIHEAITELEKRGFKRFILFGICSGAVQAVKAAKGNSKIGGLILVNTGSDDGNTEANPQLAAQYYLKRSIWNLRAWKNLFTGKVKYRDLFFTLFSALLHKLTGKGKNKPSIEENIQRGIQRFIKQGASILMVLSDRHAQFYELHRKAFDALKCEQFKTLVYAETDHLFTSLPVQQDLIKQICLWSGEQASNWASDIIEKPILAANPG